MKLTTGSFAAAILLLCGTFAATAQTVTVTGTVLSSDGTGPVIGAAVFEEGVQGNGTITDIDGVFTIQVGSGAMLTISSVGYKTITIPSSEAENIILPLDSELLNEVVVTGYSVQRKSDLTGSISVVDMDELAKQNENNPVKALQGRVPGMNVTADGNPSGSATIRIRGIGTLNNNDPLFIIDGVPTKGGMHELNGNDIESIQILKDAS